MAEATTGHDPTQQQHYSECKLISGIFAQCLQLALGVLAGSTLVYKRHTEISNQRPYDVWLMDVSKQGVQSVFVHFSNIALSVIFASMPFESASTSHDECAFYFISFVLDTFLGIHLIWLVLRGVKSVAASLNWQSLRQQGFYGIPPSFDWYVKQLYVFLGATIVSKFVIGFVMLCFKNHIDQLGTFIFRRFHLRPDTELTVVMIICPAFLNAVQYWMQDNILASHGRHDYDIVAEARKVDDDDDDKERLTMSPGLAHRGRTNS